MIPGRRQLILNCWTRCEQKIAVYAAPTHNRWAHSNSLIYRTHSKIITIINFHFWSQAARAMARRFSKNRVISISLMRMWEHLTKTIAWRIDLFPVVKLCSNNLIRLLTNSILSIQEALYLMMNIIYRSIHKLLPSHKYMLISSWGRIIYIEAASIIKILALPIKGIA